jgi:hypothetical protein
MLMRWLLGVGAAAAAAGCASVSGTIAGELTRYGLDQPRARCVGDRLASDLSTEQLRELATAARAYGRNDPNPDRLTAADLARVAGQLRDPQVPIAVGRAALACGLRVSDVL